VMRERLSHAAGLRRGQRATLAAIADLVGSVDGLPADLSTNPKRRLSRR
jgi:hypothetical protein